MKHKAKKKADLAALRKKAEKKLSKQTERAKKLSARDIRDLAHELGTYQIELEIQNEEMRSAQEELETSRSRYAELYDFAPVGYFTIDERGLVREANLTGAELLGTTRRLLINKPFALFIAEADDKAAFSAHCKEVFRNKTRQSCEIRLKGNNGFVFPAQLQSIAAEIFGGKDGSIHTAMIDITERKQAENALRKSEERLKRSQGIAHLGSWELDIVNNVLTWSDEVYRIFGLKPQEFSATYEAFLEAVHPDDRKAVDAAYSGSLREGKNSYEIEHRVVRKSTGEVRFVHEKCEHVRDASGRIILSVGMVQDITERKWAEESLRIKDVAIATSMNGIAFSDLSGMMTYANDAFLALWGYKSRDEVLARHVAEFWKSPADARNIIEMLAKQETWRGELQALRPDGEAFPVEISASMVKNSMGEPLCMMASFIDITERKRAEEKLRKTSERYRSYIDVTGQLGWTANAAGEVVEDLPSWRAYTGQSVDEIMGWGWSTALHPDDVEHTAQIWKKAVAEKSEYEAEYRIRRSDGIYRLFLARGIPMVSESGDIREWIGTCIDITERKQADDTIRESEAKFRAFFESSAVGTAQIDLRGRFFLVNEQFCRLTGYSRKELMEMTVAELSHPDDRSRDLEMLSKYLQGDIPFYNVEKRYCRKDGSTYWVNVTASLVRNAEGKPLYSTGVIQDITERKQAEEALKKMHSELEVRVAERTVQVEEQARILGAFFKHTQTCLVFLDRKFNFILVNEAYARACSRRVSDFNGHNHFVDYPSDELKEQFQRVVDTGEPYIVFGRPFVFPDHPEWGVSYWDLAVAPILDNNGSVELLIFSLLDVTERKKSVENISRLNRLYTVLTKVNEAIVRIRDRETLFGQVCRIAVEDGSFKMAWIGLTDPETLVVKPVASFGDSGGYLDNVVIRAADVPEGRGPTGRAVCGGETVICRDVEHDDIMRPWREKALGHGFRSSAAIPLRSDTGVIGTLTLYAGSPRFFTDDEIGLLTSLADDVSFAVQAMETEKRRKEAERRTTITNELLALFARTPERKAYLAATVELIRQWCECGSAGIRVSDGLGNIPYSSCTGFSEEFLESERTLSLERDSCACTRVVRGAPEPQDLPAMTAGGSFYSNNTARFVEGLTEEQKSRFRGVCVRYGFLSVAVVPIRYRKTVLGAIHVADEREGMVPLASVEFLEHIALFIGEALYRFGVEQESSRLAAAVESAADAVVVTEATRGTIRFVNAAFERITGYSSDDAVGRDIHILDSGKHDEAFYQAMRETLTRDGVWNGRLIGKKKDGTFYFEDCTTAPVMSPSGEIINYVSIKRDVTERLRLESIADSANLMDNIGFVFSGVRHEIGNPINSAKMALSVLQHKLETIDKNAVRDYVDRSLAEIGRVEQLLRNLKNFNLYETPEMESLDTAAFLDRFLGLVREDLEKKGITISREISPGAEQVLADPRALQQVLLNVITNAADALTGSKGPRITLTAEHEQSRVVIRVTDNGTGMTEKQQQDLFKPFYTSKPGGTGLGLVIVKKMLSQMNGDIEIMSVPNEGTLVNIFLPEGTNAEDR